MSVLIKGMEMPETCADCNFSTWNGFESVYCDVNAEFIPRKEWKEKRQDWCPLIEVPKHGRLIDADELLNRKDLGIYDLSELKEILSYAPTIIEAEGT